MAYWFSDVEVFAAYYSGAGQWSIVAPAVRELSGRFGIRRIARVSERSPRRRPPSQRDHLLLRSPRRCAKHVLPPGSKLAG
jgi:hypothetical protein